MKGERLTEELARGLAAPTRRRTVLAGLGAGLAVALGAVAGEPKAAAHRRRHPKRCRRPCVNGELCIDGRCQRDTGPANDRARDAQGSRALRPRQVAAAGRQNPSWQLRPAKHSQSPGQVAASPEASS